MRTTTRDLLEYAVFAAPCWLMPVMSVIGLLWLGGNKSQWDRIPFALAFLAGSLTGLTALTAVLVRRLRSEYAIGLPSAFFLLTGLLTCVAPWWKYHFVGPEGGSSTPEDGQLTMVLLMLWPAPIYAHWLISGLWHRAPR